MGRREDDEADRRRAAQAALAQVEGDGELFASSALSKTMGRIGDHFAGRDGGDAADAIEIWGRRIGRSLALVFAITLVVQLIFFFGTK